MLALYRSRVTGHAFTDCFRAVAKPEVGIVKRRYWNGRGKPVPLNPQLTPIGCICAAKVLTRNDPNRCTLLPPSAPQDRCPGGLPTAVVAFRSVPQADLNEPLPTDHRLPGVVSPNQRN